MQAMLLNLHNFRLSEEADAMLLKVLCDVATMYSSTHMLATIQMYVKLCACWYVHSRV